MTATRPSALLTIGQPHPLSPGEQALWNARHLLPPGFTFNTPVLPGIVVDLANVALRIAVEIDGYAYHDGAGRAKAQADRQRDRRLAAAGYLPLHFTSNEAVHATPTVIDEIRQQSATRAAEVAKTREVETARWEAELLRQRLDHHANPRTQVKELTRRITNWVQEHHGAGAARDTAVDINTTLKREYGPANQRDEHTNRAILVFLDDWWTRYRVTHNISAADIPAADAKSCPDCQRFTCVCFTCGWCHEERGYEAPIDNICVDCFYYDDTAVVCEYDCGATTAMAYAGDIEQLTWVCDSCRTKLTGRAS